MSAARRTTPPAPQRATSAVARPELTKRAVARPERPRAERSQPGANATRRAAPARPGGRSLPDRPARAAPRPRRPHGPARQIGVKAGVRTKPGAARAGRAGAVARLSADLPFLAVADGALRDERGQVVRLLGLRSQGGTGDMDLRDAAALLADVAPGQRCVAVPLAYAAQMKPAALAELDARIAGHAATGTYTLLRLEARLWMHGHHLRLARRYALEPAVHFALMGRSPLAARLWNAAQAVRQLHARALVWLPLESAQVALAAGAGEGMGWLWDAARPQGPRPAALAGTLRQPVLLDGWLPSTHSPMVHDRLMLLCRHGGLGWLARNPGPWLTSERGVPVMSRAARAVQRAVHLSGFGASS